MSRCYEFTFVNPQAGEQFKLRGYGNTRRSAERSARGKLRDKKREPRMFVTVGLARHVPEDER